MLALLLLLVGATVVPLVGYELTDGSRVGTMLTTVVWLGSWLLLGLVYGYGGEDLDQFLGCPPASC